MQQPEISIHPLIGRLRLNDAETDGRQMVDNLEAQNRIDKINTYCVSVPDDTKHNMYLLYCFCLSC